MRYFGSKLKFLDFIEDTIFSFLNGVRCSTFCDLFAGSGNVGMLFKKRGFEVTSNDVEYFSYVLNRHYIGNCKKVNLYPNLILKKDEVDYHYFIYENYAKNRLYFQSGNAVSIDVIRTNLEKIKIDISEDDYFFNLAALIEATDKVANTVNYYNTFLKYYQKSSYNKLKLKEIEVVESDKNCKVYNEDALQLVQKFNWDIVYIDPPINVRQYSDNYHLLNTLAKYDSPQIKGVTGIRTDNYKSPFCYKDKADIAFTELIKKINARYIFVSYNSEGIVSNDFIKSLLIKRGRYNLMSTKSEVNRKSNFNANMKIKKPVIEYLHCVEVLN